MDLKNISKLSDNQLVELYRNPTTVVEIKKAIIKEINFRELSLTESDKEESVEEFNDNQKLLLLFTPFLMGYHRKTFFKEKWNRKKEKEFWSYINLGLAIYVVIILIGLFAKSL